MIFILLSAFKGDTSTPSTKGRSAGYGRSEEQIERGGNGLGTVRIENAGGVRTTTLARVEKWPAPPPRNATNQRLNPPQIRFGQLKWSRRCPCGIAAPAYLPSFTRVGALDS